ncbi:MAG: mechanosensitive ion channel family protein [Acidimicrobiales bacterium]
MTPHLLLAAQATDPALIDACGAPDTSTVICEAVFNLTGNRFLSGAADVLIVTPAKIVLVLVIAFVVNRVARRFIRRFVDGLKGERVRRRLGSLRDMSPDLIPGTGSGASVRGAQRADTVGALLKSTATFVIWSIAMLMVLGELGLNLGPLIAGAGIVGVALGFGAQNLVRDFLSGMFMIAEDQFGVGDIVDAGEASGVVEAVTLRITRLRDVNGTVWHIPNGAITRIGNKSQQWSRAVIDLDVAYDTNLASAKAVIQEVAAEVAADEAWSAIIIEPPEVWGVEHLGADGISIRLVVKTLPAQQFTVAREIRSRIKERFDADGIEIPFPQRVVWHRNEDGTAAPAEPTTRAKPRKSAARKRSS